MESVPRSQVTEFPGLSSMQMYGEIPVYVCVCMCVCVCIRIPGAKFNANVCTAILIIIDARYHDFNGFPVVNWY